MLCCCCSLLKTGRERCRSASLRMMADSKNDYDDEDTPSKRESHYNQQRSSLRSDKSDARSQLTSRERLDDFNLDISKPYTDRADSETLPSPSSPAPNVPYTRSRKSSIAKSKGRSRAYSSRGRSKSTPDDAKRLEELLAPESWVNPYELLAQPDNSIPLQDLAKRRDNASNPPSRGSRTQQRTSRLPPSFRAASRADTPGSQLDITALPSMTAATSKPEFDTPITPPPQHSRLLTELYITSYLILFAILGTLARLGLQALTFYPSAPLAFSELWANVAGTFIIGFLAEDKRLFHAEWGRSQSRADEEEMRVSEPVGRAASPDRRRERARHGKVKRTIPLYIGLATGFCGSFTSFSSFVRDILLALSNDLRVPLSHPSTPLSSTTSTIPRNGGYSFLAICSVLITTISTCYAALKCGAHLALLLDPIIPHLPFRLTRRFLDPLCVVLGWGCWIAAIMLSVFPPEDSWRGQALFACVFAPTGCLLRYYISLFLNPLLQTFPIGTFTANIFGTAVLAMCYDLQRVPLLSTGIVGGSVIGCQVLQGLMDGFCGALTTVSTWILEFEALKRRHAYVYGATSVAVALGLCVAIMGGVRWTVGWEDIVCIV